MLAPIWQFDAIRSKVFDPRIAVARAGVANVFSGRGVLTQVAANVPQMTFDQDGKLRGLRVETARQNQLTWCRDFTSADWVKVGVSAVMTGTGVDGVANSCSTLTATTGNGTVKQVRVLASGSTSVFLKRVTGTGVVSISSDAGTTWSDVVLSTTQFKRFYLQSGCSAFMIRIGTLGDVILADYAQAEDSTMPTSPIYTAAAPVTRPGDDVNLVLPTSWDLSEGTMLSIGSMDFQETAGSVLIADMRTGGPIQRILQYAASSQIRTLSQTILPPASTTGQLVESVTYPVPRFVIASSWSSKAGRLAHCLNGGVVRSATVATLSANSARKLGLGCSSGSGGGSQFAGGYLERVVVWDQALSDAELQGLTR